MALRFLVVRKHPQGGLNTARKKILPKKLGSLKIPKTLRRVGNKALADPQIVKILSGALVSMATSVAAQKVVQKLLGGAALARSVANSKALGNVTDMVRQAFEDALQTRHPKPPVEPRQSGKAKSRKAASNSDASASEANEEASADKRH